MRKGTKLMQSSVVLFYLPHGSTGGTVDNQFKDTNRFCRPGIMGPSNTFTQRLTSYRRCARCIRCGPAYSTERPKQTRSEMELSSIFDRTTQTNQKENGIIHQPILFSKQRDYGQLRKTFDADATLHSVSLPNDTPYIPAMFASSFQLLSFIACTGMHGTHSLPSKYPYTGLCICTVPVQIILYGNIVVYK
jgi:hypothetical protein